MIPTPIGAILILIGGWLLFRSSVEMLVFVLMASLLSGASAVDMPVLGHSSIPPVTLALGFLGLRLLRGDIRKSPAWSEGINFNAWLLVFCIYCAVTAFILPRMFADRIDLIPMAQATAGYVPLQPSSQNLTQAFYLLGTGFAGLAGTAIATRRTSPQVFVSAMIAVTWIHVVTGLIDLAASAAHVEGVFDFVRNGAYAELTQEEGVFHRISGLEPEPSAYAGLGSVFLVLMTEFWLRGVKWRQTGIAALAMLALMLLSTSSTAFGVVAIYGALLTARAVLLPGSIPIGKAATLLAVAGALGAGAISLLLLKPRLAESILGTLSDLTVHKSESESGILRALCAKQGWDAFKLTRGLGVGVGSFRSSSLVMAILGSVGPAGLVVFGGYCLQVFRPGRRITYTSANDLRSDVGAGAGWAAIVSLVPAAIASAGADPGVLFALLCGLSLGWRRRTFAAAASGPLPLMGTPQAQAG